MSEAKHTAGPWSHRNGRIFQTDRPELTIANVARAADGDYYPVNGELLAAAPELLEALEMLVALEADGKQADESAIAYWERARAAIAKANGVQS